eukprot:gene48430-63470_t
MPDPSAIEIVAAAPWHRADWDRLYAGYAAFYCVEQTPEIRDRVWSWLMDAAHDVKGLLALDAAGAPIGLAHYRPFARPLSASVGGFLDDLFVDPSARGSGAAGGRVRGGAAIGRARGRAGPLPPPPPPPPRRPAPPARRGAPRRRRKRRGGGG